MPHAIEVEIERNYAAFQAVVADLLPEKGGQYALMKDQQIVELYPTAAAAERAGFARFADAPYSIQLITNEPVDLGFIAHALLTR